MDKRNRSEPLDGTANGVSNYEQRTTNELLRTTRATRTPSKVDRQQTELTELLGHPRMQKDESHNAAEYRYRGATQKKSIISHFR